MSGEAHIGHMIGGRFEDFCGPVAYRGKEGCKHILCTRRSLDEGRCFGWHCSHCDGPSSYQGHLMSGRYVDGKYREFADGTPRLSCQPGYTEAELAT